MHSAATFRFGLHIAAAAGHDHGKLQGLALGRTAARGGL
jgi:hypothetical protein